MSDTTLVDRIAAIQGLRPATAERVAEAYPSAEALAAATQDDLTAITGIGAVTAARIVEEFASTAPAAEAADDTAAEAADDTAEEAPGATTDDTAEEGPGAAADDTTEDATEPATVTAIDAGRPAETGQAARADEADDPVEQLKVAAKVVVTGAFAVVGTIQEHLPEVKDSVSKAAGAIVDLGREVGRAIFRRAS